MATQEQTAQAVDDRYPLKFPVTSEGKEIKEVILRRVKGKGLVKAEREMRARGVKDPGEMERTMYVLAVSLELPVEAVLEFDSGDITELSGKAQSLGFF